MRIGVNHIQEIYKICNLLYTPEYLGVYFFDINKSLLVIKNCKLKENSL